MSSSSTPTTSLSSSTTVSSSAAATTSSGGGGSFGPPSSSLYLFTFLATLFLLLFVSSAIVLRSFFLRRRFRRRIEEAIAAGVLQTPTAGAPGPRWKLNKPVLWDASLVPARDEKWEHITPIAAAVNGVDPPAEDSAPTPSATDASYFPRRVPFSINRFLRRSPRERAASPPMPAVSIPSSPNPAAEQATTENPQDPLARVSEVRVAVLISMPNPHHTGDASVKGKDRSLEGYWDEEEGVPDVVIGVAQAHLTGEEGKYNQFPV